jgi:D-sedoheptulose 7-phosphate isomerase
MPTVRSLELLVARSVRDGIRVRAALLAQCCREIVAACDLVVACVTNGHKVLFCGNGGSAADAQHLAAELVGRYVSERRALPGIALTVDTSILTAVGNDYGFEQVFARQVEGLGAPGDVLVAITTSGGSPNVLAAMKAARAKGMKVLGLTGAMGKAFVEACDVGIAVPSRTTSRVQECKLVILSGCVKMISSLIMDTAAVTSNLQRLRANRGLSQGALAEAAGISRPAYRAIEKGESVPRVDTLMAIARALEG